MSTSQHAMTLEQAVHRKKQSKVKQQATKESDVALWNYLCGDGDIRHLFDYYDLLDEGR